MAAPSRHAAIPCSTISSGCSGRFGLASLPWMPPVSAQVIMTFVFTSGMKHLLIQLRQKIHPTIIHRNLARYVATCRHPLIHRPGIGAKGQDLTYTPHRSIVGRREMQPRVGVAATTPTRGLGGDAVTAESAADKSSFQPRWRCQP